MKLGEVCESISDGDHLAPPKCDSGVPFATISDIRHNRFDLSHITRFVPESYFDKIDAKRKIRKGDVLYSVVGSYGIPVYAEQDLRLAFQRHITILRPGNSLVPRFLYYAMLDTGFYKRAENVAVGAAQKTISLTSLRCLEIDLPPLQTQRRIADILSAYDDKIANNRRRMELLEESARLLYRKMFGDGTSGTAGTSWDVKPLSEVADVLYGKDHKKLVDGHIPCYGSGGVMRYCDTAIYDKPSVLIPRKGSIGNVMYVDEPFWSVDTMFYTRMKIRSC